MVMKGRQRVAEGGTGRHSVTALALAAGLVAAPCRPLPPLAAQSPVVLLATTTSTRDAGLLDSLLPVFERQTHYSVKVIAVGSGQALAMGRRGDADVVLSHAPEAERALVDSGYFARRRIVMHNEFLIVGPARDPAGLRGLSDPVAAFHKVRSEEHTSELQSHSDLVCRLLLEKKKVSQRSSRVRPHDRKPPRPLQ